MVDTHIQSAITANGANLCIYFRTGAETLDMDKFDATQGTYFGWWYNPQNGRFYTTKWKRPTIVYNVAESH